MDERQIDQAIESVDRALQSRLALIATKTSATDGEIDCVSCGEEIPEQRRILVPGAKRCVSCQSTRERR